MKQFHFELLSLIGATNGNCVHESANFSSTILQTKLQILFGHEN